MHAPATLNRSYSAAVGNISSYKRYCLCGFASAIVVHCVIGILSLFVLMAVTFRMHTDRVVFQYSYTSAINKLPLLLPSSSSSATAIISSSLVDSLASSSSSSSSSSSLPSLEELLPSSSFIRQSSSSGSNNNNNQKIDHGHETKKNKLFCVALPKGTDHLYIAANLHNSEDVLLSTWLNEMKRFLLLLTRCDQNRVFVKQKANDDGNDDDDGDNTSSSETKAKLSPFGRAVREQRRRIRHQRQQQQQEQASSSKHKSGKYYYYYARVFVSIFTNVCVDRTNDILHNDLQPWLDEHRIPHDLQLEGQVEGGYATRPPIFDRIDWLSRVRNAAMKPLWDYGTDLFVVREGGGKKLNNNKGTRRLEHRKGGRKRRRAAVPESVVVSSSEGNADDPAGNARLLEKNIGDIVDVAEGRRRRRDDQQLQEEVSGKRPENEKQQQQQQQQEQEQGKEEQQEEHEEEEHADDGVADVDRHRVSSDNNELQAFENRRRQHHQHPDHQRQHFQHHQQHQQHVHQRRRHRGAFGEDDTGAGGRIAGRHGEAEGEEGEQRRHEDRHLLSLAATPEDGDDDVKRNKNPVANNNDDDDDDDDGLLLLFQPPSPSVEATRVLFLNDIVFTAEDFLLLLHTNDGHYDMTCGMDYYFNFYDTWVSRDLDDRPFWGVPPYTPEAETSRGIKNLKPVSVNCCWNGAIAARAGVFLKTTTTAASDAEVSSRQQRRALTSSSSSSSSSDSLEGWKKKKAIILSKLHSEKKSSDGGRRRKNKFDHGPEEAEGLQEQTMQELERALWQVNHEILKREKEIMIVKAATVNGNSKNNNRAAIAMASSSSPSSSSSSVGTFKPNVVFRMTTSNACSISECLLLCHDMRQTQFGSFRDIFINPIVRVAYERDGYLSHHGTSFQSDFFIATAWVLERVNVQWWFPSYVAAPRVKKKKKGTPQKNEKENTNSKEVPPRWRRHGFEGLSDDDDEHNKKAQHLAEGHQEEQEDSNCLNVNTGDEAKETTLVVAHELLFLAVFGLSFGAALAVMLLRWWWVVARRSPNNNGGGGGGVLPFVFSRKFLTILKMQRSFLPSSSSSSSPFRSRGSSSSSDQQQLDGEASVGENNNNNKDNNNNSNALQQYGGASSPSPSPSSSSSSSSSSLSCKRILAILRDYLKSLAMCFFCYDASYAVELIETGGGGAGGGAGSSSSSNLFGGGYDSDDLKSV